MTVLITNAQREVPLSISRMKHVARCAVRQLALRGPGKFQITFIGSQQIRALNRQFLRHDRLTDVLSFRYDGEPACPGEGGVVGEILIAPRQARAYAKAHGVPYENELARYVVHGLLHWLGHEDRTRAEQHQMRALEDKLLTHCGIRNDLAGDTGGEAPAARSRRRR